MKVAFLGLGVMGYPMAGHLQAKGHEVTVYNRTTAKAEAWAKQHGGAFGATVAEAVKGSQLVMMCVGNDNDLMEVGQAALAAMPPGTTLVDHTTASADAARKLYAIAKAKGIAFIDGPVSGGQAGAEKGQLTVMCGGDQAPFDAAKPVIDCYAKATTLMGESGAGQLTKMVNQICIAGLGAGTGRGLGLCREGRSGWKSGAGRDFQGGCAVVANGKSWPHHAETRVQLRLRGRLDAQGSGHLHGRSQAKWCKTADYGPNRSVLRRCAESRRQPLRYVLADHTPVAIAGSGFTPDGAHAYTGRV